MTKDSLIYKIIFEHQDKIYEIYAKHISEGALMGFIEVEELVFSSAEDQLLVDPSEERLRLEFVGVGRSYIPLHAILRIDEVQKEGTAKIQDGSPVPNIKHFPGKKVLRDKEADDS